MDDRSFNKPSMYPHLRKPPSTSSSSRKTESSPADGHLIEPHSPRPPPTPEPEIPPPTTRPTFPLGYPTVTVMAPIGYYQPHFYGSPSMSPARHFGSLQPPAGALPLWNLYPIPGPDSTRQTSVIRHTDKITKPSIIQRAPKIPSPPQPLPEEDGVRSRKRRRGSARNLSLPPANSPARASSPSLPSPSTSHAVYAKFNRERRKTYIGEMETYRTRMRKVVGESRVTLDGIQAENRVLRVEIDQLGQELTKNDRLMDVLKSLSR